MVMETGIEITGKKELLLSGSKVLVFNCN